MDEPNRILVKQKSVNDIIIRIARDITDPDDFADELQILAAAGEDDTVKIQLITNGGSVYTAHLLCRAIRECKAHTIGYIGPMCASAGTSIALACEEWEIDEMSTFMIHSASYGGWGKASEVKASINHTNRMMDRWIRNSYEGFLTEDEIERCLEGKDYYFDSEELGERLVAYAEYRDLARQKAVAEMQAELDALRAKLIDTPEEQE